MTHRFVKLSRPISNLDPDIFIISDKHSFKFFVKHDLKKAEDAFTMSYNLMII